MSLLTPLYVLGALAIGLPILFHLIQRRPKGYQEFSSLMFLQPSPPRITRRSRITNWLLLLLRALAVLLLTAAFARPFLRSFDQRPLETPQRRVAIVLDRSGSMRQLGVWEAAMRHVDLVLGELGPEDDVGLFTFDREVKTLVRFGSQSQLSTAEQQKLIREAIEDLQPGWSTTNVGQALTTVADQLAAANSETPADSATVVLVSDLQETADLDGLQGYQWPERLYLDLRTVDSAAGNAYAQRLPDAPDLDPGKFRIRIHNEENSDQSNFTLAWQPASTPVADADTITPNVPPIRVQIPPGRTRTLTLDRPASSARLMLAGDRQPFDNALYISRQPIITHDLMFVGDIGETPGSLMYFVQLADLGVGPNKIRIVGRTLADIPAALSPQQTSLVVFGRLPTNPWISVLNDYLSDGGRVLFVLDPTELYPLRFAETAERTPAVRTANTAPEIDTTPLARLLGMQSLTVEPIESGGDAFLTDLGFQNELFAPFAEPGFGDFSKIRFWRHVRLTTDHEAPWSVLARFDDGSPAVMQRDVGNGRCWLLASGWRPETSQLALSSKFVPLLATMVGRAAETNSALRDRIVGDIIDLTSLDASQVVYPSGRVESIDSSAVARFDATTEVGLYSVVAEERAFPIAVNLSTAESRLLPLDVAQLERLGVPVSPLISANRQMEQQRQLRDFELESRQRIWRWLVIATLLVLALETYLAGRASQAPTAVTATTGS